MKLEDFRIELLFLISEALRSATAFYQLQWKQRMVLSEGVEYIFVILSFFSNRINNISFLSTCEVIVKTHAQRCKNTHTSTYTEVAPNRNVYTTGSLPTSSLQSSKADKIQTLPSTSRSRAILKTHAVQCIKGSITKYMWVQSQNYIL